MIVKEPGSGRQRKSMKRRLKKCPICGGRYGYSLGRDSQIRIEEHRDEAGKARCSGSNAIVGQD